MVLQGLHRTRQSAPQNAVVDEKSRGVTGRLRVRRFFLTLLGIAGAPFAAWAVVVLHSGHRFVRIDMLTADVAAALVVACFSWLAVRLGHFGRAASVLMCAAGMILTPVGFAFAAFGTGTSLIALILGPVNSIAVAVTAGICFPQAVRGNAFIYFPAFALAGLVGLFVTGFWVSVAVGPSS